MVIFGSYHYMSDEIHSQLDALINQFSTVADEEPESFTIEYDKDWPSPCYKTQGANGELVSWSPALQEGQCNFAQLEQALEISLDKQFCAYFTRYFSDNLQVLAPDGMCELLQVWNADDFERLQENLIGHVLMKRRLKQPITLFFALTDEDDFMLSVDNATGNVVLEPVGKKPMRVIAPSLADFIGSLKVSR
jgi:SecY interacting protein Syd